MWALMCGLVSGGITPMSHPWLFIFGIILTGPLVCGASQIINDYCDREVDAINEPDRPIPSGRVSERRAFQFAFAWSLIAQLWSFNLGGYTCESLQEQHQFGLVVARTQQAAKARAKARWLKGSLQVHKDDLHGIESMGDVDDCLPIDGIGGWRISLQSVPNPPETDLKPDWFGYWRIDGRLPKPRPEAVI